MYQGCGDGFGMTRGKDMYCALYFHYYFISSTSGGQALDWRGWGPSLYKKLVAYRAALPRDEEEAGKAGQNTRRRARGAAGGEHHRAFVPRRLWGCGKSQGPRSHLQKNSHKSRFWILWILLILLRSIVFPKRLATSLYSCVWVCKGISWKEKVAPCYPGPGPPPPQAGGRWVLPLPGRAAQCSRSPSEAAWGWPHSHRCNLGQKRQNDILEADYNHCQWLRHFLPSWIIMWQKQ